MMMKDHEDYKDYLPRVVRDGIRLANYALIQCKWPQAVNWINSVASWMNYWLLTPEDMDEYWGSRQQWLPKPPDLEHQSIERYDDLRKKHELYELTLKKLGIEED